MVKTSLSRSTGKQQGRGSQETKHDLCCIVVAD